MISARARLAGVALPVVLTACGGGGLAARPADPIVVPAVVPAIGPVVIENMGGAMEGHTPRGFAGSGIGLFAGDNLNAGFPDGDGVQLYLSFDLPSDVVAADGAVLESNVLTVRGTPFDDLGPLLAELVTYNEFGPSLFDLPADANAVECGRVGESDLRCDVGEATANALSAGADRLQFRIRFETSGDLDDSPDLAMFFLTDSNTNEPGIFTLRIDAAAP